MLSDEASRKGRGEGGAGSKVAILTGRAAGEHFPKVGYSKG